MYSIPVREHTWIKQKTSKSNCKANTAGFITPHSTDTVPAISGYEKTRFKSDQDFKPVLTSSKM